MYRIVTAVIHDVADRYCAGKKRKPAWQHKWHGLEKVKGDELILGPLRLAP